MNKSLSGKQLLTGNLLSIWDALDKLNIDYITEDFDVWISSEDYHKHKNELARYGIY